MHFDEMKQSDREAEESARGECMKTNHMTKTTVKFSNTLQFDTASNTCVLYKCHIKRTLLYWIVISLMFPIKLNWSFADACQRGSFSLLLAFFLLSLSFALFCSFLLLTLLISSILLHFITLFLFQNEQKKMSELVIFFQLIWIANALLHPACICRCKAKSMHLHIQLHRVYFVFFIVSTSFLCILYILRPKL